MLPVFVIQAGESLVLDAKTNIAGMLLVKSAATNAGIAFDNLGRSPIACLLDIDINVAAAVFVQMNLTLAAGVELFNYGETNVSIFQS